MSCCLASLSAHGPTPGLAAYGASTAAVLRWCSALDAELRAARRPVRVRAICPAADTAMVAGVAGDPSSALLFTGTRLLRVDEVADAAVGMLGSLRQVRTLPTWRGTLLRTSQLLPAASGFVLPVLRSWGERRRRGYR